MKFVVSVFWMLVLFGSMHVVAKQIFTPGLEPDFYATRAALILAVIAAATIYAIVCEPSS